MEAYLFSGRRIAKRYSKNLLWLQGFEEEFIHKNEEHVPKLRLVLSALLTLHEALVPVLPGLKINSVWSGKNGGPKVNLTESIDVKLWQTALDLMTNSMNEACFLIGMPDLCNGWADGLKGTSCLVSSSLPTSFPSSLLPSLAL